MELPNADIERQANHRALLKALAWETPRGQVRRGMLGLVIAAAAFNAFAAPIVEMVERPYIASTGPGTVGVMLFWMPLMIGVLCGEVGAMACWLVWAEGRFWRRLVIHWAVGLVLGLCLLCGWLLTMIDAWGPGSSPLIFYEAAWLACGLPATSLAVQVPMWPFRTHLGWHVAPAKEAPEASRQPLSIADILIGTTVVAVSLGLIRLLPGASNPFVMMQMGVMGLALAVASLVVLIPATLLVLRMSSAAIGVLVYLGAVFLSECGFIVVGSMISNFWPPGEDVFAMLWGSLVFAATVAAPLFVWRVCGYRLVWAKERRAK